MKTQEEEQKKTPGRHKQKNRGISGNGRGGRGGDFCRYRTNDRPEAPVFMRRVIKSAEHIDEMCTYH